MDKSRTLNTKSRKMGIADGKDRGRYFNALWLWRWFGKAKPGTPFKRTIDNTFNTVSRFTFHIVRK